MINPFLLRDAFLADAEPEALAEFSTDGEYVCVSCGDRLFRLKKGNLCGECFCGQAPERGLPRPRHRFVTITGAMWTCRYCKKAVERTMTPAVLREARNKSQKES